MKLLNKGLWPVMLTPFEESGEVDVQALEHLTEFYIEAGSDGLFANCLSSEMFQLSNEERYLITKTVVKKTAGRIPVITTGSFSNNMDLCTEFVKKIHDTGVHGVVISTNQPCDEFASEDEFRTKMEYLINKTGNIPLGLYECPVPYKRLISPGLLKWLSEFDRFVYHKDTSCDMEQISKKLLATMGTSLGIYNAHVPTGLNSLVQGARGLSPIAANFYPELFTYLLKYHDDSTKSADIQVLNEYLDMMDTIIHINYPISAKLFLQKRGMNIKPYSRIVRSSFTKHDINKVNMLLRVFERITNELNIERVQL
ncbi:dihydrodipicolinate synthase family protein [Arenibacter palladensis]|uniref:dihydrodipicolinate synthase family protein n=1 Tax=Arenibacter palladensis TaxID=237373 RepID=UPI002FD5E362